MSCGGGRGKTSTNNEMHINGAVRVREVQRIQLIGATHKLAGNVRADGEHGRQRPLGGG
jgi:hypothetical protein